jgi:hypothetical protein
VAIINHKGDIITNSVNGPLALNGRVLIAGSVGNARFLTDTKVIFQDFRDELQLSILDIITGEVTKAANLGANILVASGDVWASWGGGKPYRDSFGAAKDTWIPLTVDGENRRILVMINHETHVTFHWWDGIGLSPTLYAGQSPGNGVAAGVYGGSAVVEFRATPETFPLLSWPKVMIRDFDLNDSCMVGYSVNHNGLVLWECGASPQGYLLAKDVDRFAPCVARQSDGTILVAATTGVGQLPHELITYKVDPLRRTVNGDPATIVDLTKAPITIPIPPPAVRMPTFTATTQKIGIGLFDEPNARADFFGDGSRNPKAVFYTRPSDDNAHNVAWPEVAAFAKAANLPVAYYTDWRNADHRKIPAADGVAVIPHLCLYPKAGESNSAFLASVEPIVASHAALGPWAGVFATYRQWNGQSYPLGEQQVLDAAEIIWNLARKYRACALWGFNYKRPWQATDANAVDGLIKWPSFQTMLSRLRAASGNADHFYDDFLLTPEIPDVTLENEMMTIPSSMLQKYWEWPDTHVVIQHKGRFLVVDRTAPFAVGLRWAAQMTNTRDGGVWSGEAWSYDREKQLLAAERDGIVYTLKVRNV